MRNTTDRSFLVGLGVLLAAACTLMGTEPPHFVDISEQIGLAYTGPVYAAAGADFDLDGWIDLAVSNHGLLKIFRNRGGGSFSGAKELGVFPPGDTHGVSWLDLDEDGWLDLYVSIGAARGFGEGPNRYHRNLGGTRFERQEDLVEELADTLGRGRCSLPWDMDGDGRLELLILNSFEESRPHRLVKRVGNGWEDRAAQHGLVLVEAECMTVVTIGERPTFIAYGAGADSGHLFRQDSQGILRDVTEAMGGDPKRVTYAVAVGDYDNDGDSDLYYVHGHGIPPAAEVQDRQLDFRLIAGDARSEPLVRFASRGLLTFDLLLAGRRDTRHVRIGANSVHPESLPWQMDPLDPRLEGRPDTDAETRSTILVWRQPDGSITIELVGRNLRFRAASGEIRSSEAIRLLAGPENRSEPQPNRLFENRQGRLIDVTHSAGVGDSHSGRDAVFFDMDNDGDLDLFVINGGTAFTNQPDVLYRNNGNGGFTDVTRQAGVAGPSAGRGSSVVALDFDNDGDLDLFTTNGDGPPMGNDGPYALFRNESLSSRSARLELIGTAENREAMGARVIIKSGGRLLEIQRYATNSRFSTSILPIHLGLEGATAAQIEIFWPSGETRSLSARAGDRLRISPAPARLED